jgi:hypothetical protein
MFDNTHGQPDPNLLGRRLLLQTTAATVLAATVGAAAGPPGTPRGPATTRSGNGSIAFGNKGTRLTIAMWDFSWLLDGEPGGAYADLERCVAGARQRGFNTLRVDAFVSQQLQKEVRFEQNWTGGLPQWGMTRTAFTCDARKRVAELARLCRKHDIWLGLDSWKSVPDAAAATDDKLDGIMTGFGEMWARALRGMREDGVLERAVWVAPLNEVPWHAARMPAVKKLNGAPVREGLTRPQATRGLDALYRRINQALAAPIHAELAGDAIPISYSSLGAEDYAARLTDLYDVVDVHFMPSVIADESDRDALEQSGKGLSGFAKFADYGKADLKRFSAAWDVACRKHYDAMLRRAYDYDRTALDHLTLPSGKRLQAVITESFGPCYWPVSPDVNQEWYKRYNGDALRTIAALPFAGSSVSNYAEPIFPAMWDDVDWLWTANTYFLTQSEAAARNGA